MSVFHTEPDWDLIEGAVDTHVHAAPDLIERYESDLELAEDIRDSGMARTVVKSHVVPTVGRTALVNEAVGDELLGGGIDSTEASADSTSMPPGSHSIWARRSSGCRPPGAKITRRRPEMPVKRSSSASDFGP